VSNQFAAQDRQSTTAGASHVSTITPSGSWVLVAVGACGLRAYPLSTTTYVVIGRARECDIVLEHHRVSRRHARVRVAPAGDVCVVEDLGSRNGTRLDCALAPHVPTQVRAGDAISIGPCTLIAVRESAASPGPSLAIDDPTGRAPSAVLVSVARSAASALIRGETGTGKQVLAETLHRLSGRPGALVAINCSAISPELLESELFGHERGAFTGAAAVKPGLLEVAGAGTVLLDEIGDMPVALQAKLLRAVESREVLRVGGTRPIAIAARFVSATHRDLLAAVDAGAFRLDLYYRLAAVTLTIPPLRERRAALVTMARDLLIAAAVRDGRMVPAMSAGAIARLQAHDWPGNVRELRNALDRALILAGDTIDAEHIVFDDPAPRASTPSANAADPAEGFGLSPPELEERARIVNALELCSGNQTRAARLLGISRSSLATKLSIYRIPRPRS
jgi:two-component system, NtrC family, response regulator AtoC